MNTSDGTAGDTWSYVISAAKQSQIWIVFGLFCKGTTSLWGWIRSIRPRRAFAAKLKPKLSQRSVISGLSSV